MSQTIELPYPPSVNAMWRSVRGRSILSAKGRAYYQLATLKIVEQSAGAAMPGRLAVRIKAYPPDNRRRDLDNLFKATLDALTKGGVYEDDSQIDVLEIVRHPSCPGGRLVVKVETI
jgi:crossover junction endodeoxyribonuclease RusA